MVIAQPCTDAAWRLVAAAWLFIGLACRSLDTA
jgi:hypothetical protein